MGLLLVVLALSACSSSNANTVTSPWPCCDDSTMTLNDLPQHLQPSCATDKGNVRMELTRSKIAITFPCRDVRRDPAAVRRHALAAVRHRNNAAERAANVIAYEQALGVSGDLVNGQRQYPDHLDTTTFFLGIAKGPVGYCQTVSDLKWRSQQLKGSVNAGLETPVHWLKIEAARIAGACPERLETFFSTMRRAGAGDAVDVVAPLLAQLM